MFKTVFKNRRVYERKWKNGVERGRLQITIWLMRISCLITNATNTYSEYRQLNDFQLQQSLDESASMLPVKYIPYPVYDSHIQHVNILR